MSLSLGATTLLDLSVLKTVISSGPRLINGSRWRRCRVIARPTTRPDIVAKRSAAISPSLNELFAARTANHPSGSCLQGLTQGLYSKRHMRTQFGDGSGLPELRAQKWPDVKQRGRGTPLSIEQGVVRSDAQAQAEIVGPNGSLLQEFLQ